MPIAIGAVCAPVYLFMLLKIDPRPGVKFFDRAREVDYVGMILTVGAFMSGVMAVNFGGVQYPWNSCRIIGLFVCSGVLFTLLALQQVFTVFTTTSRRIFPVEFFKKKTILILFAMTSAFTRSDSAFEFGVRLLPYIFLMILAIISNGAILSAYGYYMPWYAIGGILVVIGGELMYTVDDMTSVARVYTVVEPEVVPSAVGFITCAQISGVTIALAIANAVFLNQSKTKIQELLLNVPKEQIQQAITRVGSQFFNELNGAVREEVLQAIVTAMSKTYIPVITAGALVLVLSLFIKRERLFMTAGGGA
ncbi:hypothetical protein OIDMADRAFT_36630 [Oidiodendron maius Zn]|uniref:Major facilitator superfamily (MFS) profile domain-containing protein n=1 Tax=Oidiodendron maius (strain Zn) TaxID=913774 RepID=A0A0C3HV43_OIDMZ|nr:hypothetical protein OIDMADRAFT_36630 [Oidiodendron maius Zn]